MRGRNRGLMVPAPGLSLDLSGGVLPAEITFSRASAAGFMDSDGVYKTVEVGEERFITGEGLLIEAGSTNYITYARDLSQSVWMKTDVSAVKNDVGIDGEDDSASNLQADANDGMALFSLTSAATSWCFSVYLKRIEGTGGVYLTKDGGTNWEEVAVGAGWQRFTVFPTGANPVVGIRLAVSGDAVCVDGAQLEYFGSSRVVLPTSAIFTEGSAVARAADVVALDVTGLDLTAFSAMIEHKIPEDVVSGYPQGMVLSDGTLDNVCNVAYYSYSANTWAVELKVGGVAVASSAAAAYPAVHGEFARNAITFGAAVAVHASNGRLWSAAIDAPASVPTFTALKFNVRGDGTYSGVMVLKRFRFWQVGLGNEMLRRATI